ncbi:MAG: ABC transporter permease [Rikenellaceae bacterium]|nr:ABC transporter permease [Rikenellaceae bacterium]
MKQLSGYLRSALYNIRHNKAYAAFCILGSALTFVFIIILLQLAYVISNDAPPLTNSSRVVQIGEDFTNRSGESIDGLTLRGVVQMRDLVEGYETYAISHNESGILQVNDQVRSVLVNFINSDYWQVNDFEFIAGRPFTKEDYAAAKPVAMIKQANARAYFGNEPAVGREVEFQGNTYEIIGEVADFSFLTNEYASLWVPYKYNKYLPSGMTSYTISYLFPEQMPETVMKQNVARALQFYFQQANEDVEIDPGKMMTQKEVRLSQFGDRMLTYGIGLIILLLMIIPAVNIVTLSIADANAQATEIAIRRAMGATRMNTFIQKMSEHFILVMVGMLLGLVLVYPTISIVETIFLDVMTGEGVRMFGRMNYWIILYEVLPLCIFFSLISGGIPAYLISKRNIADTLKGGTKS